MCCISRHPELMTYRYLFRPNRHALSHAHTAAASRLHSEQDVRSPEIARSHAHRQLLLCNQPSLLYVCCAPTILLLFPFVLRGRYTRALQKAALVGELSLSNIGGVMGGVVEFGAGTDRTGQGLGDAGKDG